MSIEKLLELQGSFLAQYPEGFQDPEMLKIGKKHNVDKLADQAKEAFDPSQFGNPEAIMQGMVQMVSRSSMMSMFEKPKFKEAIGTSSAATRENLTDGLYNLLHEDVEKGFNQILDELVKMKLAKWSLISLFPFYYSITDNWFIKPNTTKSILKYFGKDELVYKPRPYYEFYRDYSEFLDNLKDEADSKLSPNNAAFTGFLMMTIS